MLLKNEDELLYQIALTFVDGVGSKIARQLINHFGTAKDILKAPVRELKAIGKMGDLKAKGCKDPELLRRSEKELSFIKEHGIATYFLTDDHYPHRLKTCTDSPLLFYHKGSVAPEAAKMVAVIGTRKNTEYGQRVCEELLAGLAGQEDMIIVSGLAYGIDAIAHKHSLKAGLPTIGVVAHGLDRIYPSSHKSLANEMLQNGGLLTEFPSGTIPDRNNFPVRNRIVAGMTDVTVIVESDEKGGAMITAYLAASYNREVAAIPGRVYDKKSDGPNKLIRKNIATMITGADDLLELMNWSKARKLKAPQPQLFPDLNPEEQQIIHTLQQNETVHSDDLLLQTGLNNSQLAATLLQLEMLDLVKTLPGKRYRINQHI